MHTGVRHAVVVGGGLAGCEAAWQLAERGNRVTLHEMRPVRTTPAHRTADLAELVCTNSFKSSDPSNAHGLLKREMRALGSILLESADATAVAAGTALAVDRRAFARAMSERIEGHPNITIERSEVSDLPDSPCIIATGPLTSQALTARIAHMLGDDGLAFYDAIAPIVSHDSIDTGIAFLASRWGKGEGDDYLNCPLDRDEYLAFLEALRAADVYAGHDWENIPYFEGCLPIEVMAERGEDTLRFGPMKPVGLRDPRTGRRPYAVVQLRREDRTGQMWNLVGFQTRLRTGEQRRTFRMIPGLGQAEFLRMGSIHRNTYLNFPARLTEYGAPHARPDVIFAGQLTGVEGYTESAASGILAGINLGRLLNGLEPAVPPPSTMIGALYRWLRDASPAEFQPMNSNFGLLEPLAEPIRDKGARRARLVERAGEDFDAWIDANLIRGERFDHEPVATMPGGSP
ncbi:MAG TPA: methylenetetrahydrofolate--tRNA-(uracil(54)-C(5))-methyltransferase (FADH(2)-oxidizing) TrmFO [Longimicrobiales bacterium]|nr:methylenetetrahydrofolate--tRNA-(uracil(54)-C(5))-methyltransferase (FADH(2)-oxidizing) TrmFO [Longimicrobiales bacterium]